MNIDERSFSNLISPYDIRDYKLVCTLSAKELPESFELDSVTVKNQKSTGSCVAHACSSIVEYHNNRQQTTAEVFSTEFIYGYRPEGYYIGEGMYIRDALKTLQKVGDCPLAALKGNHDCPAAMEAVEAKLESLLPLADPHRISSYAKINTTEEIKNALVTNGYVLISIPWYKDYKLKNNIYTYSSDETIGYHALVIYGWNKDGWLVHNSWGKNWGDNGKFILPFDFKLTEAWAISDNITFDDNFKKPEEINVFIKWFSGIINTIVNFFHKIFKK